MGSLRISKGSLAATLPKFSPKSKTSPVLLVSTEHSFSQSVIQVELNSPPPIAITANWHQPISIIASEKSPSPTAIYLLTFQNTERINNWACVCVELIRIWQLFSVVCVYFIFFLFYLVCVIHKWFNQRGIKYKSLAMNYSTINLKHIVNNILYQAA